MISSTKWIADTLLRTNTKTADSKRRADPLKIIMLLLIPFAASHDELAAIALPVFGAPFVSIPVPSMERQQQVDPLLRVRSTNPAAASVVSQFLAAYAWLLSHDDTRRDYNSSALARNIERGLESLASIRDEVGDIDLGPALNESLRACWGEDARQLSRDEAVDAIFACAWGLSL